MCLILFAYGASERFPLVLAANRDEFYDRPCSPASFWPEAPSVLGGRDLKAGGTWLGITRNGKIASVTNFRDTRRFRPDAPSRGLIPPLYLTGKEGAGAFLGRLASGAAAYNGFSLILGTLGELWFLSNRGGKPARIQPGIHGLSNHLLDTPWPKVEHGKQMLKSALTLEPGRLEKALLDALTDDSLPPDDRLPQTGLTLEKERALAPLFVSTPVYGTRSSTVVLWDRRGVAVFVERSFDQSGRVRGTSHFVLETKA